MNKGQLLLKPQDDMIILELEKDNSVLSIVSKFRRIPFEMAKFKKQRVITPEERLCYNSERHYGTLHCK